MQEDTLFDELHEAILKSATQPMHRSAWISDSMWNIFNMHVAMGCKQTRDNDEIQCLGCRIKASLNSDLKNLNDTSGTNIKSLLTMYAALWLAERC